MKFKIVTCHSRAGINPLNLSDKKYVCLRVWHCRTLYFVNTVYQDIMLLMVQWLLVQH